MLHAAGLPASGNTAVSSACAKGMSDQSKSGTPMSTEMSPVEVRSHVSRPRLVHSATEATFASRISISAAPRVALPQTSSAEPSAFQNITRASASSQSSNTASWLKPTPSSIPHSLGHGTRHRVGRISRIDNNEVIAIGMHLLKVQRHANALLEMEMELPSGSLALAKE